MEPKISPDAEQVYVVGAPRYPFAHPTEQDCPVARPVQEEDATMLLATGTEFVQGVGVHTGKVPAKVVSAWQLHDCTDPARL